MIAGISESKTLTKHVSCICKSKFYSRKLIQIKSRMSLWVQWSERTSKRSYLEACYMNLWKCLGSTIDDLVIAWL